MPIRLILTLFALGGLACTKDSDETDTDTDTDSGETEEVFHPLVPEEYKYLWNTDACTTLDGGLGSQVYVVAEGSSDASMNYQFTERWYWFMAEDGWDDDCVDTWDISGTFTQFDYGQLNCSQCEEAFDYTRTLTESNCNINYFRLFDLEEGPDEQIYTGIMLFDTHGPNGNPNENNKMLVVNGNEVQQSLFVMNPNYALGHAYPETENVPSHPANFDWIGDRCIGSGK